MSRMSGGCLLKVSVALAVFGLALSMFLTGCSSPASNGRGDPIVISVAVVPNMADPGAVFAGEGGTLNFLITIVGDGVFPVDLREDVAIIARNAADTMDVPMFGGIYVLAGTVENSGEDSALGFSFDETIDEGTYRVVVEVRGVRSNSFTMAVVPAFLVESVIVEPDTNNPGLAVAGTAGILNYLIIVESDADVFPINFQGEYVDVTLLGGAALPDGISVNMGTITASGEAFPLSFLVDRPVAATYSLVVTVHGRPSVPFDLVVIPALSGTVNIDGDPAVGATLSAVIDDLDGYGPPVFRWQRGIYPGFADIANAMAQTYAAQVDDAGQTVRVIVSREGYHGYRVSAPTLSITNPHDPPLQGTVTIDGGDPVIGVTSVLTANIDTLDGDGVPAFQWQRGIYPNFANIVGAIGQTHALHGDDMGQSLRVIVTRAGRSGNRIGGPTVPVESLFVADNIAALRNADPFPGTITIGTRVADERIAPQVLDFGGRPIEITLTSGTPGDTLSLSGPGAMFTVGDGVTLILGDITVRGMAANTGGALMVADRGGTLVMNAGARIAGNANTSGSPDTQGGGVRVEAGGTFTMRAGEITGNDAMFGGGVLSLGVFAMEGGEIFGNVATEGGGVCVEAGGTFTMSAGRIHRNAGNAIAGGVHNFGAFTMENGEITQNVSNIGGGVFNAGTFTMRTGEITANRATTVGTATGAAGGVANWVGGTFNMEDGMVSDNTSTSQAGGVINLGTFNMRGGEISGNEATNQGGGIQNEGVFTMENGRISGNDAGLGGGVLNLANIFTMRDGAIVDNESALGGGVLNAIGGTFTMEGGKVHDNVGAFGGGVNNTAGSTFNLRGGEVSGNLSLQGGGVLVEGPAGGRVAGALNMTGGTITGNDVMTQTGVTRSGFGGGVYNDGIFTMGGGTIHDNAGPQGGGVFNEGTFNMNSATAAITGNVSVQGGGILNWEDAVFNMRDGAISGNRATQLAGGVGNAGTFRIANGIIHGSDAEEDLRNTASNGASLITGGAVAEYGTFANGGFSAAGDLLGTNLTIEVANGVLIRPVATAASLSPNANAIEDAGRLRTLPDGWALPGRRTLPEGWMLSDEASVPALRSALESRQEPLHRR